MHHALLSLVLAAVSLAPVFSTPTGLTSTRHQNTDDTTLLNFALTLEHLESEFYDEGLKKFSDKDFTAAGYPDFVRRRILQIADHEKAHVRFLSDALGTKAVKPCTYKFPYEDVKSFLDLGQKLEGVGSSAYSGVSSLLTNKDYSKAADTILSIEARHSSFLSSPVQKINPWGGAFETPLSMNLASNLAALFVDTCPSSNPAFPAVVYPGLVFTGTPQPGQSAAFSIHDPSASSPSSNSTSSTNSMSNTNSPSNTNSTSITNSTSNATSNLLAASSGSGGISPGAGTIVPSALTAANNVPNTKSTSSTGGGATTAPTHMVFLMGLDQTFVPINNDGTVMMPSNLSGLVYVVATNSAKELTDESTVAGPAMLSFPRDSNDKLIVQGTKSV